MGQCQCSTSRPVSILSLDKSKKLIPTTVVRHNRDSNPASGSCEPNSQPLTNPSTPKGIDRTIRLRKLTHLPDKWKNHCLVTGTREVPKPTPKKSQTEDEVVTVVQQKPPQGGFINDLIDRQLQEDSLCGKVGSFLQRVSP